MKDTTPKLTPSSYTPRPSTLFQPSTKNNKKEISTRPNTPNSCYQNLLFPKFYIIKYKLFIPPRGPLHPAYSSYKVQQSSHSPISKSSHNPYIDASIPTPVSPSFPPDS